MFIAVRTANDPRSIIQPVRRQVASLDKNAPIYHVETLDQYFAQSVLLPRLITLLLSGFAGLALLLACLGVYGVISYIVVQRKHEIGIRMALGARKSDVLTMIIGEGLRPALAGIAIGIVGALQLTRPFVEFALWREASRSAHICRRLADANRRGAVGMLHPRPPGCEHRSYGRLAIRVSLRMQ